MNGEDARNTDEHEAIFAWCGGHVVLLAERSETSWGVARGWRRGDQLADIRHWSFSSPQLLAGQIRRLAREATGNYRHGDAAAAALLAWAAEQPQAADRHSEPPASVPLAPSDHLLDSVD